MSTLNTCPNSKQCTDMSNNSVTVPYPKTIANRWHSCYLCCWELDGDMNAAINVKNIAVGRTVIKASVCVSYVDAGLAQKYTLYSSTS